MVLVGIPSKVQPRLEHTLIEASLRDTEVKRREDLMVKMVVAELPLLRVTWRTDFRHELSPANLGREYIAVLGGANRQEFFGEVAAYQNRRGYHQQQDSQQAATNPHPTDE